MRIKKSGIENVTKITNRKNITPNFKYRLSLYTYPFTENGRYLIKHTLTGEVTELTKDEWNAVYRLNGKGEGYAFLVDNGLAELAKRRYIVETDYDEVKQYIQAVFLLRTMAGVKEGLKTYTIFPTTGCNARCVYCYEEGYAVKTMSEETSERLVDFICETRHDDMIKLRWFGGEPLAGEHIIRNICTALKEREVPFESDMITNASLLTKELAHEARVLWNLTKVQVSLDGARDDYMFRKNYYDPDKHNYDVVMRAIHYLSDEGIKVNLRVNVDFDNIGNMEGFLREIKSVFGDMENITLYITPLYQEQQKARCIELYKEIFRLTDLQKELGIPLNTRKKRKSSGIRLNNCMADSLDKSIVITPDGVFNNCEHLPETHTWGNIFDGVTDKKRFEELSGQPEIDDKCSKCTFLPVCTPYYKTGCPGWFDKCYEYNCLKTERELHNLLKGENAELMDDEQDDD